MTQVRWPIEWGCRCGSIPVPASYGLPASFVVDEVHGTLSAYKTRGLMEK